MTERRLPLQQIPITLQDRSLVRPLKRKPMRLSCTAFVSPLSEVNRPAVHVKARHSMGTRWKKIWNELSNTPCASKLSFEHRLPLPTSGDVRKGTLGSFPV